jgi:hypothetical protein
VLGRRWTSEHLNYFKATLAHDRLVPLDLDEIEDGGEGASQAVLCRRVRWVGIGCISTWQAWNKLSGFLARGTPGNQQGLQQITITV